jgi:hypothetical protein
MDSRIEQPQFDIQDNSWVRDALLHEKADNPALQRLQARVLKNSDASEVITSYDRMHHKHNRS